MEKSELTPSEQRYVDVMVGAFALVESVEGTKSAAEFVVSNVIGSDEIIAQADDHSFLFENGIDSSSL
jgi:hypothetical protein